MLISKNNGEVTNPFGFLRDRLTVKAATKRATPLRLNILYYLYCLLISAEIFILLTDKKLTGLRCPRPIDGYIAIPNSHAPSYWIN